ncbi:predicted protein [Sclerotinia sclerotiorum 1980 UF-70]|uniref:Uncharacterized protein n=1 Tax=Sclerotinia sclerotiorum (strain ATCC 18683 / 1980 / Ss-1) TaxID=665079 RepID=A7E7G5_SCLS1|nr:predicted protein [Sclerotinia sclerotiorum 1980 UF-70]EDN96317.1 predicted protein [Sclerotinia sclerotiorum 1980 UF-70]
MTKHTDILLTLAESELELGFIYIFKFLDSQRSRTVDVFIQEDDRIMGDNRRGLFAFYRNMPCFSSLCVKLI